MAASGASMSITLARRTGQSEPLAELPAVEQRLFDVDQRGGRSAKLVSVFTDVRVALIDDSIQDKSGSYCFSEDSEVVARQSSHQPWPSCPDRRFIPVHSQSRNSLLAR